MSEPGPHLLGRRRSTPDPRDFTVSMVRGASPLELSFQKLLASSRVAPATKAWAREVMPLIAPAPPPEPEPSPEPATQNYVWGLDDAVLDQLETNHCGGFGGCQWGNVQPVDDNYGADDAHALYYEAVAIGTGGERNEDGVESRWVAKALQARGRLDTYAFAKTTDEVTAWVREKGPVMVGTDWTADMLKPQGGYVKPTGKLLGGHFWVICGHLPEEPQPAYLGLNSWGATWGLDGFFKIAVSDFASLLVGLDPQYPGDAIVSPELALPA